MLQYNQAPNPGAPLFKTMTNVSIAAASLAAHGIRCRRDWGSAGRWLAEVDGVQYCVGGLVLLAAAASPDPIEALDKACQ